MTSEQKAAYVMAQSVAAMATIEGMKALNTERERDGIALAYDESSFDEVITRHRLHHDDLYEIFHGP